MDLLLIQKLDSRKNYSCELLQNIENYKFILINQFRENQSSTTLGSYLYPLLIAPIIIPVYSFIDENEEFRRIEIINKDNDKLETYNSTFISYQTNNFVYIEHMWGEDVVFHVYGIK